MSTTTSSSANNKSEPTSEQQALIMAYLEKAQPLVVEELKKHHSEQEDSKQECLVCVPDKVFDSVMRKLRKSSSVKIHFVEDDYVTEFRKVEGKLKAYDRRFPEGRNVEKQSVGLDVTTSIVLSIKGFSLKMLRIYNKRATEETNADLALLFSQTYNQSLFTVRGSMFCATLLAMMLWCHENDITLITNGSHIGFACKEETAESLKEMSATWVGVVTGLAKSYALEDISAAASA